MSLWDELLHLTQNLKGHVLDAGCGNGVYSKRLLEIPGVKYVTGVDLLHVEEVNNPSEVAFVRADLQLLPFPDGFFDGVLCWHTLEHCIELMAILSELRRVLVKDGLLMLSLPTGGTGLARAEGHVFEIMPEELEEICLTVGFEPVTETHFDSTGSQSRLFRGRNE